MKKFLLTSFVLALSACSGLSEDAASEPLSQDERAQYERAVFAGGCFWCVEADFDKIEGVVSTISGYTGGFVDNPTYEQVSYKDTGHYEAVEILFDPELVSYETLVDYFFRHVDPTDPGGQFCDRGDSYRTAIFAADEAQEEIARAEKLEITQSGVLDKPIATPILTLETFWPAEGYHQDYYQKNPVRYKYYRTACGRDRKVAQVWAGEKTH